MVEISKATVICKQVVLFQNVRIVDINDNKPEFVKKTYQFFLDENECNVSLRVPPIEVFDPDTSERNSRLSVRIADRPLPASTRMPPAAIREHVSVRSESDDGNYPLLYVRKPFDYETHGDKVEFELVAYDVDNLTDTCLVTIHVRDLNDNAPVFMNDNATFAMNENSPPNSFIGQVPILTSIIASLRRVIRFFSPKRCFKTCFNHNF